MTYYWSILTLELGDFLLLHRLTEIRSLLVLTHLKILQVLHAFLNLPL